ncbi:hypothetical protein HPB52_002858 [Rhipicephalus sanguineus]|uniref:G patch domain-containing protein n=1 Tax=Rhipicephalus sanguineus TaxID=34632 RepID=A0A9D4QGH8_RHISA|nr:hypothetical protein HPB52_002858 [Rhipicephalus sanguineus]
MAEDYLFLGTPLEELDEDEIPRKKFQPDLTVRDAQGRRRFHGAFTGGFSAGYFNTVGTKEGMTVQQKPSTHAAQTTWGNSESPLKGSKYEMTLLTLPNNGSDFGSHHEFTKVQYLVPRH